MADERPLAEPTKTLPSMQQSEMQRTRSRELVDDNNNLSEALKKTYAQITVVTLLFTKNYKIA